MSWSPWHDRSQVYGPTKFTPGYEDKEPALEQLRKALDRDFPRYAIPKGWKVNGVFKDNHEYHGLCFNPHLGMWFQLAWNADGTCITGNCGDGQWDLIFPELRPAEK